MYMCICSVVFVILMCRIFQSICQHIVLEHLQSSSYSHACCVRINRCAANISLLKCCKKNLAFKIAQKRITTWHFHSYRASKIEEQRYSVRTLSSYTVHRIQNGKRRSNQKRREEETKREKCASKNETRKKNKHENNRVEQKISVWFIFRLLHPWAVALYFVFCAEKFPCDNIIIFACIHRCV